MILDKNPLSKALIFDLDGTLVDTMPVHYEAWRKILKKRGIEFSEELFNTFCGIPTFKIVPMINEIFNVNLIPEEIVAEKEEAFLNSIDSIKIIESVFEIVKKYYGKLPMSIGTGGYRRIAEVTMRKVGLDKYFNIIVTADDVEHHKPHPDTFLLCAKKMGVSPEYCEVFEDGDNGLIAAKKAGMIATDVRKYVLIKN